MNINKVLKELRQSKQYSLQDIAKILNVSKSAVNMYERGERMPPPDYLIRVCKLFNVDMNYLYKYDLVIEEKKPIEPEFDGLCLKALTLFRQMPDEKKKAFLLLLDNFPKE